MPVIFLGRIKYKASQYGGDIMEVFMTSMFVLLIIALLLIIYSIVHDRKTQKLMNKIFPQKPIFDGRKMEVIE